MGDELATIVAWIGEKEEYIAGGLTRRTKCCKRSKYFLEYRRDNPSNCPGLIDLDQHGNGFAASP
jgi:hypothetical protein